METLRFPIGKFSFPKSITSQERRRWIDEIATAPANMRAGVAGLFRRAVGHSLSPGGWTVRQVVHTCPTVISMRMSASSWRSPKMSPRSNPTMKPHGPGLPIPRQRQSRVRSHCSRRCISGGFACSSLFQRWSSGASSGIRKSRHAARPDSGHVRVAQPSSRRSHHRLARADGLG